LLTLVNGAWEVFGRKAIGKETVRAEDYSSTRTPSESMDLSLFR
jgi:hypothetical protein